MTAPRTSRRPIGAATCRRGRGDYVPAEPFDWFRRACGDGILGRRERLSSDNVRSRVPSAPRDRFRQTPLIFMYWQRRIVLLPMSQWQSLCDSGTLSRLNVGAVTFQDRTLRTVRESEPNHGPRRVSMRHREC